HLHLPSFPTRRSSDLHICPLLHCKENTPDKTRPRFWKTSLNSTRDLPRRASGSVWRPSFVEITSLRNAGCRKPSPSITSSKLARSEEHTSELQSLRHL